MGKFATWALAGLDYAQKPRPPWGYIWDRWGEGASEWYNFPHEKHSLFLVCFPCVSRGVLFLVGSVALHLGIPFANMAQGTLKNLHTARSTDEPSLLPAVPMGYRSHACQGSHKKLGLPGFLWVYFGGCPAVGVLYGGVF